MLVLRRRAGQHINVGQTRVHILKGSAQVGIEAPPSTPICRGELGPVVGHAQEGLARAIAHLDPEDLSLAQIAILQLAVRRLTGD